MVCRWATPMPRTLGGGTLGVPQCARDGSADTIGVPPGGVARQEAFTTFRDLAMVREFLVSPGASFTTGTDVLVDGGVVAAMPMASRLLEGDGEARMAAEEDAG